MAKLAAEALRQVRNLTEHYLAKDRIEAATRLEAAVRAALARVDDPTTRWVPAPRPYPEVGRAGYRWIKQHRYWFGYRAGADGATIYHVAYDSADIPSRVGGRRPSHPSSFDGGLQDPE